MRDIPGYDGRYAVTEDGRVWSYPKKAPSAGFFHRGRWLKSHIGRSGYLYVSLRDEGGKSVFCLLHRLVMMTFNPVSIIDTSERLEVNHIDGVKTNPHLSNLEWVTSGQNREHAWR